MTVLYPSDDPIRAVIAFLFRRVAPAGAEQPAGVELTLTREGTDRYSLRRDGVLAAAALSPDAAASWLLHLVCAELATQSTGDLLMHAAVVALNGTALLMPAASGSGKSTLSLYLQSRGFMHLTDELACVRQAPLRVQGLGIPIKIKHSGRAALNGYVALPTYRRSVAEGLDELLVQPAGTVQWDIDLPLGAIVFPRYTPGATFTLTPLTPAQTGLRLTSSVVNTGDLAASGFTQLTALAAGVPGYDLHFSGLAQVAPNVDTLRRLATGRRADQ